MLSAILLPVLLVGQFQRPIAPNEPPPTGQRVEVKDGDTVLIRGGARVRIVHRSEGIIRILYNAEQRWLVVLYDFSDPSGAPPDGKVDGSFRFEDVEGVWPLGERWEGAATIDDYSMTQGGMRAGMGITTNAGFFQLFSGGPAVGPSQWFRDSRAAAILTYRGGGGGTMGSRLTFDQAEAQVVQEVAHSIERRQQMTANPAQPGEPRSNLSFVMTPGNTTPRDPSATIPVRVGGGIRTPPKIVDVRPEYPAIAQSARVQGVVILEIIIGTDGSVTDAKVLRSIPLLDQPALDCVRQWKYEPTLLNGTPVPVIMTVTVNFAMQ